MSELLRPIFEESNEVTELQRHREMAVAYLGEVSTALCFASTEYHNIIETIISLNMKLREHGIREPASIALETAL